MIGALIGLVFGLGLVALMGWVRARRPLPLILRIGPFVGVPGSAEASLRRSRPPRGPRRQRQVDTGPAPEWVASGAGVGLLAGVVLATQGSTVVVVPLLAGVGGAAGRWLGSALARAALRRRRRAIQRQLPMLADLLSLAVTAGLTPVAALESAASSLRGPVAAEVRVTVADIHAGVSTDDALRSMAVRVDLTEFDRFVEAVLLAVSMGTPLADVVRGQATDLRVEERRVLMEVAGRKDALMLVPIVFLVLPSVLAIALYPGLQSLRLVLP